MPKPIKLRPHAVRIDAPCDMVYQWVSAFGAGGTNAEGESSRMLYRDGNDAIVQFKTRSGRTLHNTIEHVKLEPPTEITFLHLEGPLLHAREEFVLEALNGATILSHRGEFIWRKILLAGWLVGMAYVRPAFERVMKRHLRQIKEGCEARAARSRLFPARQDPPPR